MVGTGAGLGSVSMFGGQGVQRPRGQSIRHVVHRMALLQRSSGKQCSGERNYRWSAFGSQACELQYDSIDFIPTLKTILGSHFRLKSYAGDTMTVVGCSAMKCYRKDLVVPFRSRARPIRRQEALIRQVHQPRLITSDLLQENSRPQRPPCLARRAYAHHSEFETPWTGFVQ